MELDTTDWSPKKKEIVQATIQLLAEEGFDRTTTARIARTAHAGEGTIYRHFRNKEDLFSKAALYSADRIFGPARENFHPHASIHAQFIQFCTDFLTTGSRLPLYHKFLEQYLNSPIGIAYRRRTLKAVIADPTIKPIFYPLNAILMNGIKMEILKDLPLQVLVALSMGPLAFILKHAAQGFVELDDELIHTVAKSCWASIRR